MSPVEMISATSTDQPEQNIARELALQLSILHLLPAWRTDCNLGRESVADLECYLITHTRELAKELAGSTVKLESPSLDETIEFAVTALPRWIELGYLADHVASSLRKKLAQRLDTISPRSADSEKLT